MAFLNEFFFGAQGTRQSLQRTVRSRQVQIWRTTSPLFPSSSTPPPLSFCSSPVFFRSYSFQGILTRTCLRRRLLLSLYCWGDQVVITQGCHKSGNGQGRQMKVGEKTVNFLGSQGKFKFKLRWFKTIQGWTRYVKSTRSQEWFMEAEPRGCYYMWHFVFDWSRKFNFLSWKSWENSQKFGNRCLCEPEKDTKVMGYC